MEGDIIYHSPLSCVGPAPASPSPDNLTITIVRVSRVTVRGVTRSGPATLDTDTSHMLTATSRHTIHLSAA